jgi:hypothetical protein
LKKQLACVTLNRSEWNRYCLQPVQIAPFPASRISILDKGIITENLVYLISKQDREGYSDLSWEWGQYEEEWVQAKGEWRGILTVDYVRILHSYGYISVKIARLSGLWQGVLHINVGPLASYPRFFRSFLVTNYVHKVLSIRIESG